MRYDVVWDQVAQKLASLWLPCLYPADWAKSRAINQAIAWIHRELSCAPRVGPARYVLRHDCIEVAYTVSAAESKVTIVDIDLAP